jgi:hypothetical protein
MAQSTMQTSMELGGHVAAPASSSPAKRWVRRERVEFGALFAVCFCIFLPAVAVRRALTLCGLVDASGGEPKSVLKEAREAARSTIPYAFMG